MSEEFAGSLAAVGAELRQRRTAAGYTLRELATAAELSPGFLSLVERGSCSLSLTSLFAVCRALEIDPAELLHSGQQPRPAAKPYAVGTKGCPDRPDVVVGERSFRVLSESFVDRGMEPLLMRVAPTSTPAPPTQHEGEEFGYLLSGRLLFTVDGAEFELNPGDHIHLSSGVPHSLVNPGGPAEALWVVSRRLF
ncbi:helix-turn-helix domain-containing protein [Sciscionella marina]|uniref:helix-turn-helix domain-containing protein n=1 Tax=Sciscionella marina TaxID=508770 RepID=UPI000370C08D|nr:cupin domain-containing protein [Sciscionella marina]